MMKRLLIICCLVCGVSIASQAQKYRTALGPRFESDKFGISLQQKLHEKGTIEGIVTVGSNEYSGTALYEWHFPLLGKRFNYYVGAGAHIGNLKDSGVFTGADAILGIEYKVNGLPILLSADLKPAVHINHADWVDLASGVSVRYVLVKEKKEKKSWWPFGDKEEDTRKRKKKKNQDSREGSIFDIFKNKDN
ncbi:hypothetical protein [Pontibacter cellulosilyticus]|uniref:DUF3575 domain-containing protein n=1 Tax=Pontibacter cellulosilyticus TaxID=1720253 RepID=A0A923SJL0_9BACT|nr:hypothetical protein [Pontibacter cellulosilyticus]MBC5993938.1 hypothetical protein [Pontibacter cellulosilyticus]